MIYTNWIAGQKSSLVNSPFLFEGNGSNKEDTSDHRHDSHTQFWQACITPVDPRRSCGTARKPRYGNQSESWERFGLSVDEWMKQYSQ